MEFGPMGVINVIITFCVGLVLLGGAAMTYHYRQAEQRLVADQPLVQKAAAAARADIANANASLPKWDNTNYKGLNEWKPKPK
jgi:hypothetical protein